MNPKRGPQRRKVAGLTCRQIVVLLILFIVLFMSAALVLGYNLGIFDRLITSETFGDPPTSIPDPQGETFDPDGLASLTPSSVGQATSLAPTNPNQGAGTPTSLATLSVAPTASLTATISSTPPPDVCAKLDLRFLNATSNVTAWRLQNTSGVSLTVSRIEIAWPESNDAIFNVFLDGIMIWSGEDLVSPTFITNWVGAPGDRVVDSLSRIEFFFGTAAATGGYDLTLRFENGCEVARSH
jgi:hypothetical protein